MANDQETCRASLHEVIVAFQKSLGRASRSVTQHAANETVFVTGQQQLYAVSGLSVKLRAGVTVDPAARDQIMLNLESCPEDASELEFQINSQPVDRIDTGVTLEELEQPAATGSRLFKVIGYLGGRPLPAAKGQAMLFPLRDAATPVDLTTDNLGRSFITLAGKDVVIDNQQPIVGAGPIAALQVVIDGAGISRMFPLLES